MNQRYSLTNIKARKKNIRKSKKRQVRNTILTSLAVCFAIGMIFGAISAKDFMVVTYAAEREFDTADRYQAEANIAKTNFIPLATTPEEAPRLIAARSNVDNAVKEADPIRTMRDTAATTGEAEGYSVVLPYGMNEIILLQELVEAEARGEPLEGKVAVANVILNRVRSDSFPDSLLGVIYQENQFEPIMKNLLQYVDVSTETVEAVEAALWGMNAVPLDTVYFYNPQIAETHWIRNNCEFVTRIGDHEFYRKEG